MCTNRLNGINANNRKPERKCILCANGKAVTYCGAGWNTTSESIQGVAVCKNQVAPQRYTNASTRPKKTCANNKLNMIQSTGVVIARILEEVSRR